MAAHKKELLEAFRPAFKEHGFKKNGATWVREDSEVFCVFNVQTSQWSELYYFNAGVYVKAVAPIGRPTEPDCHCGRAFLAKKKRQRFAPILQISRISGCRSRRRSRICSDW